MMQQPPETLDVPNVIPIFPLPRVVLLPGEMLPLQIFEPRYLDMVRDAIATHQVIGMVEVRPGCEDQMPDAPPVLAVGCLGYIASHEELSDGRILIFLLGIQRFTINDELAATTAYRQVRVDYDSASEEPQEMAAVIGLRDELREMLPGLVDLDDDARRQFEGHMPEVSDAQLIALASQILEIDSDRKRELLEAKSVADRFVMVYEDLYRHLDGQPGIQHPEPNSLN
jgi:Lon protease-like protein